MLGLPLTDMRSERAALVVERCRHRQPDLCAFTHPAEDNSVNRQGHGGRARTYLFQSDSANCLPLGRCIWGETDITGNVDITRARPREDQGHASVDLNPVLAQL